MFELLPGASDCSREQEGRIPALMKLEVSTCEQLLVILKVQWHQDEFHLPKNIINDASQNLIFG